MCPSTHTRLLNAGKASEKAEKTAKTSQLNVHEKCLACPISIIGSCKGLTSASEITQLEAETQDSNGQRRHVWVGCVADSRECQIECTVKYCITYTKRWHYNACASPTFRTHAKSSCKIQFSSLPQHLTHTASRPHRQIWNQMQIKFQKKKNDQHQQMCIQKDECLIGRLIDHNISGKVEEKNSIINIYWAFKMPHHTTSISPKLK